MLEAPILSGKRIFGGHLTLNTRLGSTSINLGAEGVKRKTRMVGMRTRVGMKTRAGVRTRRVGYM